MKTQFLTLAIIFGTIILYSACHEKVEMDHGISIEGLPNDTTIVESSILSFDITITAADGLSQLKVNDNFVEVKGLKSYTTNYFIIGSLDSYYKRNEEDEVIVSIFAKDLDGDVIQKSVRIKIISFAKAIEENLQDTSFVYISDNIISDQIWRTGKVYVIDGKVSVLPGKKLTIEKGVIVKATNNFNEPTSLIISRGAYIDAQGTENEPIIFTSTSDLILPGSFESDLRGFFSDLPESFEEDPFVFTGQNGLWGGLIILGKARISSYGDLIENQLPSIPDSDVYGKYGGLDNEDYSGILKYVSIRYAGTKNRVGELLPSLTLAGVGRGTKIEYIDIFISSSDGISILGGSVNVKNSFVFLAANSGVKIDYGWNGTFDNFALVNCYESSIYIEGPKGNYFGGIHQFSNGFLYTWNGRGLIYLGENYHSEIKECIVQGFENLEYGIKQINSSHSYKIEGLEAVDYGGPMYDPTTEFNRLFKGFGGNQIKLVKPDEVTVGPYLEIYNGHWSYGHSFLERGSSGLLGRK